MVADLRIVPDPEEPVTGGGGGGGDDEMEQLAFAAAMIVESVIARIDWGGEHLRDAARAVTRDDTDADLVLGLMKLVAANIEVLVPDVSG